MYSYLYLSLYSPPLLNLCLESLRCFCAFFLKPSERNDWLDPSFCNHFWQGWQMGSSSSVLRSNVIDDMATNMLLCYFCEPMCYRLQIKLLGTVNKQRLANCHTDSQSNSRFYWWWYVSICPHKQGIIEWLLQQLGITDARLCTILHRQVLS